jgi:hypothetical protein
LSQGGGKGRRKEGKDHRGAKEGKEGSHRSDLYPFAPMQGRWKVGEEKRKEEGKERRDTVEEDRREHGLPRPRRSLDVS